MIKIKNNLTGLLKDKKGTAGLEFALMTPVLMIGLLIVADIGLAIHERMNVDQALRSGAEFAMASVEDVDTLAAMVKASASGAYGSDPNDVNSADEMTVDVTPTCACPDASGNRGASVDCNQLCVGDIPPSIYYDFAATKTYSAIFLGSFQLSSEISVQVR